MVMVMMMMMMMMVMMKVLTCRTRAENGARSVAAGASIFTGVCLTPGCVHLTEGARVTCTNHYNRTISYGSANKINLK